MRRKLDGKRRRSFVSRLFGVAVNVAVIGGLLWWWHPDFVFDRLDREQVADLDAYCGLVRDFEDVETDAALSTPEAMTSTFEHLADIARDTAEVAPPPVREAHERLARGMEMLVEALKRERPTSLSGAVSTTETLASEIEKELGDLEGETAVVEAFAIEECNVSFD